MQPPEQLAVALGGELRLAVARLGRLGVGLGRGDDAALAVDGAAGGAVHEAARARRLGGGEHVDRAEDVDAGVVRGVGHRAAHVDLGAEVEHHLGLPVGAEVAHGIAVAHVGLHEAGSLGQRALEVLAPAGGEVVDDRDLVALLEDGVHHVRADEAGPACHKRPHRAGMVAAAYLGSGLEQPRPDPIGAVAAAARREEVAAADRAHESARKPRRPTFVTCRLVGNMFDFDPKTQARRGSSSSTPRPAGEGIDSAHGRLGGGKPHTGSPPAKPHVSCKTCRTSAHPAVVPCTAAHSAQLLGPALPDRPRRSRGTRPAR